MAQDGFGWIYLAFFLIIPLSRIIPKIIQKWKEKNSPLPKARIENTDEISENFETIQKSYKEDVPNEMKPHSLEMLVLGELNRGVKNFDKIKKNLGIETTKLDETLESLENQGLMKVNKKQGIFGPKIELVPTEEGSKKIYFK